MLVGLGLARDGGVSAVIRCWSQVFGGPTPCRGRSVSTTTVSCPCPNCGPAGRAGVSGLGGSASSSDESDPMWTTVRRAKRVRKARMLVNTEADSSESGGSTQS